MTSSDEAKPVCCGACKTRPAISTQGEASEERPRCIQCREATKGDEDQPVGTREFHENLEG